MLWIALIIVWLGLGICGYLLDRADRPEVETWSQFDRRCGLVRIIRGPFYLLDAWADRGSVYKEVKW